MTHISEISGCTLYKTRTNSRLWTQEKQISVNPSIQYNMKEDLFTCSAMMMMMMKIEEEHCIKPEAAGWTERGQTVQLHLKVIHLNEFPKNKKDSREKSGTVNPLRVGCFLITVLFRIEVLSFHCFFQLKSYLETQMYVDFVQNKYFVWLKALFSTQTHRKATRCIFKTHILHFILM